VSLKIVARGARGTYQIIGKLKGRRIHQSTGTTSRSHAEAMRVRLENEILDQAVFGQRPTAIFAQAANIYLDGDGSPRFLRPLVEHFGRWRLSDIDQLAVLAFVRLTYSGASPQTINRQTFSPLVANLAGGTEGWPMWSAPVHAATPA
jgi:integrase/recombinase XerD